ncbi:hypothetical protein HUT18_15420 [Streptomyces sp. NA04227]|uniref:hypothetical protein n=1 Tax=Streptomyces sp. NA04227 TaxID=2742136 RepID=UPI001591A4F3|nr:hypothetical protein [Streptomyces sp. NA04227]QKW07560.1 hypothetical protein HUT18_15420 [Streptomyces sp. NA04227]
MDWTEAEYVEYLAGERRRYAWVMREYGGMGPEAAEAAALEEYPYESADAPFRGLVFHDEAWHWAMLRIHGHAYWVERPELTDQSAAYQALD